MERGRQRHAIEDCSTDERLRQETLCRRQWTDKYVEHSETLIRQNVIVVWIQLWRYGGKGTDGWTDRRMDVWINQSIIYLWMTRHRPRCARCWGWQRNVHPPQRHHHQWCWSRCDAASLQVGRWEFQSWTQSRSRRSPSRPPCGSPRKLSSKRCLRPDKTTKSQFKLTTYKCLYVATWISCDVHSPSALSGRYDTIHDIRVDFLDAIIISVKRMHPEKAQWVRHTQKSWALKTNETGLLCFSGCWKCAFPFAAPLTRIFGPHGGGVI